MIIEIFGLPAVGKTTCADALCRREGYQRPQLNTKYAIAWYALLFWVKYPIFTFKIFLLIVRFSKSGVYTKCIHGLGVRFARYMVPVVGTRVIDEGLLQNIMNLSDELLSKKEIESLFYSMPKITDAYLHIVVSKSTQKEYAAKRGRVFSRTKSEEEDEQLLSISTAHEKMLSKLLEENNYNVQTGSCETIKI